MRSQLRMRNRRGVDSTGATETSMGETYPDRPTNVVPVLQDFAADVLTGTSGRLYPLRGAVDEEGILPSTLFVSTAPSDGDVRVLPDGTMFFDAHEVIEEDEVTFQFRVRDNRGGLSVAKTATITVTVTEPAVTTVAASTVAATTATLNGNLTSLGTPGTVDLLFEYRETGAGSWTETAEVEETETGTFSANVTGLTAETEHEFRAVVRWGTASEVVGTTLEFTTLAA